MVGGTAAIVAEATRASARSGFSFYPDAAPATLDCILVYGQSNAIPSGNNGNATLTSALYPNALMLQNPVQFFGDTAVDPAIVGGLQPVQNPPSNPLQIQVPLAFALDQFCTDASLSATKRLWGTVGYGGQPIATFQQGTGTYNNLLLCGSKLSSSALAVARACACLGVIFIQGESFSTGYAAALTTLANNLTADLKAQTGQAASPMFLIVQINNASDSAAFNQIVLDQLSVAQTVPNCTLLGPSYFAPLCADNIHATEIGRLVQADSWAYALKKIFVDKVAWNWLTVTSITRAANVITVNYALPPGCSTIAIDTDWVGASAPAANYGFVYTDDSGSPPAISSVAVASATSIAITLSGTPTGNKTLQCAMGQSIVSGWSAARSQIMAETTQQSAFYRLGFPVPQHSRHWGERFSKVVP
jgi:hypothetical protein